MYKFRLIIVLLIFSLASCSKNQNPNMDSQFKEYLSKLEVKLSKAYTDYALASFNSSISGKEEDYKTTADKEMMLNKLLSDKSTFEKLKEFQEKGNIQNDTLKRALFVMYNQYLAKQIDTNDLNQMTQMQSNIEKKFSTFRANVNGKLISDNDVESILKKETNSEKLKAAWMAHKEVGNTVASDIIALVKKRNQAAKKLGFSNYHEMTMKLGEQDPKELDAFFDELDNLTRASFLSLKKEIDSSLASKYKIKESELMPWHYQNRYFQEAPAIYDLDLDDFFKNRNIEDLTKKYYASIGMPIDELVAKSDLYEKVGKNQHAFCTDIDRDKNDIRVVCNITPSHRWMETMLHEYGHAVYQKYVDQSLPWILKQPAHTFATEGVAMLFGRFGMQAEWLSDVAGMTAEEKAKYEVVGRKTLRLQQLVFSRWVQVVYRFEKSMYENPDQDLNALWWTLVEKYQGMKKPEGRNSPDWSTKIHIALYPCYYHNYLLGEIFASQFYTYINTNIVKNPEGKNSSFYNNQQVSEFMINKVFKPALFYNWKVMIKNATGEEFSPKFYAKQFVN